MADELSAGIYPHSNREPNVAQVAEERVHPAADAPGCAALDWPVCDSLQGRHSAIGFFAPHEMLAATPDSSRTQSQSRGRTPAGCSKITAPITMRGTMILPGETAAGSAGMQPYRAIAWWAHRDDHSSARISFPRSCQGVFKAR